MGGGYKILIISILCNIQFFIKLLNGKKTAKNYSFFIPKWNKVLQNGAVCLYHLRRVVFLNLSYSLSFLRYSLLKG